MPTPDTKTANNSTISKFVIKILNTKRIYPCAAMSKLENEIDPVIYSLINVTGEEIANSQENSVLVGDSTDTADCTDLIIRVILR